MVQFEISDLQRKQRRVMMDETLFFVLSISDDDNHN